MKTWQEIEGPFSPSEVITLQSFAKEKICLEIGCWIGRSTVATASVAEKVVAVDTFTPHPNQQDQMDEFTTLAAFADNITGHKNIYPFAGMSADVVPMLKNDCFDLVFIDANHQYAHVKEDIEVSLPKLKVGGVMMFHDWGWHTPTDGGVSKAIKEFFVNIERGNGSIAYAIKEAECRK